MWNIGGKLAAWMSLILYHQAASAVGGGRIRLRELLCEHGAGMSRQKALLSFPLKAPQIVLKHGTHWTLGDWRKQDNWGIVPICRRTKGCQTTWHVCGLSPLVFLYSRVVCVSASVHGRLFTVWCCIHKVPCASALTLSQEIKGWTASGQVIQSADDECSSSWK